MHSQAFSTDELRAAFDDHFHPLPERMLDALPSSLAGKTQSLQKRAAGKKDLLVSIRGQNGLSEPSNSQHLKQYAFSIVSVVKVFNLIMVSFVCFGVGVGS